MPKTFRSMLLLLVFSISLLPAQNRQGVVRITPFTGSGIPVSELATLERLVASHIAELRLFRLIDDTGRELALGETELALALGYQTNANIPLTADYVLSGHLGRIGDLYVFTLENTRVSNGEKISVSNTSASINDAVLHARTLTRSLFGKADDVSPAQPGAMVLTRTQPDIQPIRQDSGNLVSQAPPADADSSDIRPSPPPADSAVLRQSPTDYELSETKPEDTVYTKTPTPELIAGTWRGDRGLETVRLFPNGSGRAVLSGGGTLRLRFSIREDTIEVMQDQANDVAMYRGSNISFDTAKKIASLARPMKWIFRISADGSTLEGIKESILVSGTSTALTVDNDYVREASWSRISR